MRLTLTKLRFTLQGLWSLFTRLSDTAPQLYLLCTVHNRNRTDREQAQAAAIFDCLLCEQKYISYRIRRPEERYSGPNIVLPCDKAPSEMPVGICEASHPAQVNVIQRLIELKDNPMGLQDFAGERLFNLCLAPISIGAGQTPFIPTPPDIKVFDL